MGCGSSSDVAQNPAPAIDNNGTVFARKNSKSKPKPPVETVTEVQKKIAEPPLAFEVSMADGKVPRKLPPLKFQKLEDQQLPQNDLTLEKLRKRQAEAEERRKKLLDLRVKSARHFQGRPSPKTQTITLKA